MVPLLSFIAGCALGLAPLRADAGTSTAILHVALGFLLILGPLLEVESRRADAILCGGVGLCVGLSWAWGLGT